MKTAVMGVAVEDGRILSLSRKNKPEKIGLVGGKVDSGETWEQALKREVFEEIGKTLTSLGPVVYQSQVESFLVVTYLIDVSSKDILVPEEGSLLTWETPENFILNSEYTEYNKNLLESLKHRKII